MISTTFASVGSPIMARRWRSHFSRAARFSPRAFFSIAINHVLSVPVVILD